MSTKKLHIIVTDKYNNVFFNGYIHKFDASRFNTCIYLEEGVFIESSLIRLTENIRSIIIVNAVVNIIYESGATAMITRA